MTKVVLQAALAEVVPGRVTQALPSSSHDLVTSSSVALSELVMTEEVLVPLVVVF